MNTKKSDTPIFENIRQISDGWIKKYVLTYRMPDESVYEYEAVSRKPIEEYERELRADGSSSSNARPDAICIVPILADGSVLLIKEFRYAINDWIVAFPAGLLEPGEKLEECVDRELREETGHRLRGDAETSVELLPQSGYSSVGMTDENVVIAKALVEPADKQHLERGEFIELFTLAPSQIDDFLESNDALIGTRCQLVLECMRENGVFQEPGHSASQDRKFLESEC